VDFDATTIMQLEDQVWIGCRVVVRTVCSVSLCLLRYLFEMHTYLVMSTGRLAMVDEDAWCRVGQDEW
jgi:hypothetical protein